jgi:hypothetical protein
MTPAGKMQDHLKKLVQGSGGVYRKVRWEGRVGCPDCFIYWAGPRMAFVEIKAGKDRVRTMQGREARRMDEAGVPVFTARTFEDLEKIVEQVRKGGCNLTLHVPYAAHQQRRST